MQQQDAIYDLEEPEEDETGDEEDLWFLPGLDEGDEAVPPGHAPQRRAANETLFDPASWRDAQGALAPALAEVTGLFGALDQRLRRGPNGWQHRLALREVSDLSWWIGDRLSQERIALWVALRIGSTDDTELALPRAGWAMRHLSGGPAPAEGLGDFLERVPRSAVRGRRVPIENTVMDLTDVMATESGLHPVVAAARLFCAWRSLGPARSAEMEAAVLASRHAAAMSRAPGWGALFLPLAQSNTSALRGQAAVEARLAAWLDGAERATLAALLHLERVAEWRQRAEGNIRNLSGRTPLLLLDLLEAWPQVSAPMAEAETGVSRAAVQRNLKTLQSYGLIREITGQGRYRVWTAVL